MSMLSKEKVLSILKARGPSVPADMTRALQSDTILIGALLSQLVSDGSVLVTHAKIGGSKLYYVKEHLPKIVRLRPHLNEKDQRTFDLLSEKKVLRDDEMTPLLRTSLRNLPDFALPAKVRLQGEEVLFWRWFIVDTNEARQLIEKKLGFSQQQAQQKQEKEQIKQETQSVDVQIKSTVTPDPQPDETLIQQAQKKKEQQVALQQEIEKEEKTKISTPVEKKKKVSSQKKLSSSPIDLQTIEDETIQQLNSVLNKKKITLTEYVTVRAKKEYDLKTIVPTPVGDLQFYAKFRAKKTVSEGDVSSALLVAQKEQLPLLIITTGKVVKKVKQNQDGLYSQVVFMEEIFE